jgi:hypothetical protein
VVDVNAALGEEFLDVAVRQRDAQVPAYCQYDYLGREAEASEGGSRDGSRTRAAGSQRASLLGHSRCNSAAPGQ